MDTYTYFQNRKGTGALAQIYPLGYRELAKRVWERVPRDSFQTQSYVDVPIDRSDSQNNVPVQHRNPVS